MNLMMLLEMASDAMGEREALKCETEAWSQAQLFAGAGRIAKLAREADAKHVALLDVASPALPLALFGAAWAGRPFVPLNYRLTEDEQEALLRRITPALLITGEGRAPALSGRDDLTVITQGEVLAEARAATASSPEAPPQKDWSMEPEDIAVLLFTSGTTGEPKAALLRHRHLVSYILGASEFMSAPEEAAGLVSVPPYHVAGIATVLSSIYTGRRIVQLPNFDAQSWLKTAERERITHAFVVPTMLARIVDELEAARLPAPSALQALSYGGGRMPLPVIESAMKCFLPQVAFTNAYGLTETSSTLTLLGPEEHRAAAGSDDPAQRRRLGSAGKPLPGVEVEIRDEAGRPLPAGEPGEIWVRGAQVSGEYLGRESRLREDGWFPTNDSGRLDEAGYLFLSGRLDDVIVRGGENLSPGEIEEVLYEHEAVADCGVVGIPDRQWGEAPAAVVVRTEKAGDVGAADLQEWVRARLRSSRVPVRIEFRDALPYNETGKLLRRKLREELAAGE